MEQVTGAVFTVAAVFIAGLVVAAVLMVRASKKEKAERKDEYDGMRRPGREAARNARRRK